VTTMMRVPAGARMHGDLRSAMSRWQALVVALDGVDDVTTEIVRLRAARHHDCHT
jgi:hypothetical protein